MKNHDFSTPCAACKLLRRRCTKECIFAQYFPPEQPQKFLSVHRVFGASNVSKMLQDLPIHHREDAVSSMVYEAQTRLRDPVYGCAGAVSKIERELTKAKAQLALAQVNNAKLQAQVANLQRDCALLYNRTNAASGTGIGNLTRMQGTSLSSEACQPVKPIFLDANGCATIEGLTTMQGTSPSSESYQQVMRLVWDANDSQRF